jgi:hypothetical protein
MFLQFGQTFSPFCLSGKGHIALVDLAGCLTQSLAPQMTRGILAGLDTFSPELPFLVLAFADGALHPFEVFPDGPHPLPEILEGSSGVVLPPRMEGVDLEFLADSLPDEGGQDVGPLTFVVVEEERRIFQGPTGGADPVSVGKDFMAFTQGEEALTLLGGIVDDVQVDVLHRKRPSRSISRRVPERRTLTPKPIMSRSTVVPRPR